MNVSVVLLQAIQENAEHSGGVQEIVKTSTECVYST